MITGETLGAVFRFGARAERGPRTAREIEQDIRNREREPRSRCGEAAAAGRTTGPAAVPLDGPSYR